MLQDSDIPAPSPPATRCGLYSSGLDVHWVQALASARQGARQSVMVAEVADDGTITLQHGRRYWNHDPAGLREVLAGSG